MYDANVFLMHLAKFINFLILIDENTEIIDEKYILVLVELLTHHNLSDSFENSQVFIV